MKLHVSYGSKIVLMMKSIIKNLKRIAEGGKGVSVPKVIVNIIVENLGDEGGQGVLAERVKELEAKYKQLFIEVGRMERDLALLRKRV